MWRPCPRDLNEALQLMRQDKLVMDTLGEHVAQAFLRSKEAEWAEYNAHGFHLGERQIHYRILNPDEIYPEREEVMPSGKDHCSV